MKKMVDAILVAAMLMACVPSMQEDALLCLGEPAGVQTLLLGAGDDETQQPPHGQPC